MTKNMQYSSLYYKESIHNLINELSEWNETSNAPSFIKTKYQEYLDNCKKAIKHYWSVIGQESLRPGSPIQIEDTGVFAMVNNLQNQARIAKELNEEKGLNINKF